MMLDLSRLNDRTKPFNQRVRVGKIVSFNVERGFGFIRPDFIEDDYEDEDVFFLIKTLHAATEGNSQGQYPRGGMRLAFRTTSDTRGPRASTVASVEDGSYITLEITRRARADVIWSRRYDTDEEDSLCADMGDYWGP